MENPLENEIKEIKKKIFIIDNQLENKSQILINLQEQNLDLHLVNKNLRKKLKDVNNGNKLQSVQLKRDNIINETTFKNIQQDFNFDNLEIIQLKEEFIELELNYKTKQKYLNETRKKIKLNSIKIDKYITDTKDFSYNLLILNEELKYLEKDFIDKSNYEKIKEFDNKTKFTNENFNFIKSNTLVIKEKENLENSIKIMREEIKIKEEKINKEKEKLKLILKEVDNNQNDYANILHENYNIKNKIKEYKTYLEKYEKFIKNVEAEINVIKKKLINNKSDVEKIEEELNNKLYFIRFSNSLVRSFFNIINTRRLQIEMIKKLENQEKSVYDFMFKKLDQLENQLQKDYKEYLILCDEEE